MSALAYIQGVLADSSIASTLSARTDGRGAVITPRSFDVQKVYGVNLRTLKLRCSLTVTGETASSEDLFDLLEEITTGILADQTAGGDYNTVLVGEWAVIQTEKNYLIFETEITISE